MGRLYPKMRERPLEFRINYEAPLAEGLVFAGLGGHGCVGSMVYPDSSLYGNHGRLINMDAATDWVWSPELGRWGLDFRGVGGNRADLFGTENIADGWRAITLAIWERHPDQNDPSGNPKLLGNGFTSPVTLFCGSYGSSVAFYVNGSIRAVFTVPRGKLYHVAGVLDGLYARVYVDGVEVNSNAFSEPLASTSSPFAIGDVPLSNTRPWLGLLADGGIWSRALTPPEISALADPSNVDLRVGGVPLILPPRRRLFASVEVPAPTFNPAWARHVNTYIGLGR